MRILVVEDEFSLADIIATKLKKEKYDVDISLDGLDGLNNALSGVYDLVILDIMLPKINGIEILKEIRDNNIDTKVIMLTAKSALDDKLVGFENGADDYLTKPFHMEELIARVDIQLRKPNAIAKDILNLDELVLDIKSMKLTNKITDMNVKVIGKEFQLIELFMNNPNQVIGKEQLFVKIWGYDTECDINTLEAYISFIRKKLKLIQSSCNIKAIRNLGYVLETNNNEVK